MVQSLPAWFFQPVAGCGFGTVYQVPINSGVHLQLFQVDWTCVKGSENIVHEHGLLFLGPFTLDLASGCSLLCSVAEATGEVTYTHTIICGPSCAAFTTSGKGFRSCELLGCPAYSGPIVQTRNLLICT